MGWKDAGDAVVYPDGSQVPQPKALCELQGYVFDAWMRMAEVFDALGEGERAAGLRAKAAPVLAERGTYHYTLKAEIVRNGQKLTATEDVAVRPGTETRVSLPLTWGGKDNANVRWKVPLTGTDGKARLDHDQSSPIVWKDRVFLIIVFWPEGVEQSAFPEHHVAPENHGESRHRSSRCP